MGNNTDLKERNNAVYGDYAMRNDVSSTNNTAVGDFALQKLTDGHNNTVIGTGAGNSASTTEGNVLLGFEAGYFETDDNTLMIDNQRRASKADAKTKALIVGTFADEVADQVLNFNAGTVTLNSLPTAQTIHFQVSAEDATLGVVDEILEATAAKVLVAATGVVKAATAVTDILTVTATVAQGDTANDLKILLTTAAVDTLAVTKTDGTKTINIALAKTTATKNTATLIQVAIRALSTVGGIDVSAYTCTAGGNWDTAAKATGETAAVSFTGGVSKDVITTGITQPSVPRNLTATTDGTATDIKAVSVIVTGTNYLNEVITETLPIFTVNTKTTVIGSKAFKTITSILIPAHDGTGATVSIGTGAKLGLWNKLTHNTILKTVFDNTVEANAPTLAVSATAIESNTVTLDSALDEKVIDVYYMV